jgi:hypothetical protein
MDRENQLMQQNYARILISARTTKSDGMIKTIRLFISESLLGLAMKIAPADTNEKKEIIDFCLSYFGKRLNVGDY